VFNATFSNISAMPWQSALLVEEPGENNRPVARPCIKSAIDLSLQQESLKIPKG